MTRSILNGLPRPACPGCRSDRFPLWTRVLVDEVEVLTHDGGTLCPSDPSFGFLVCEDCKGAGTLIDDDGSVSGTVGLVIPCVCSEIVFPVEIGPEDEPMPGYRAQSFTPGLPAPVEVAA